MMDAVSVQQRFAQVVARTPDAIAVSSPAGTLTYAELDERAEQFISLAVDGANRMQALIDDLLTFARIGRDAEPFEVVSLQACVELA